MIGGYRSGKCTALLGPNPSAFGQPISGILRVEVWATSGCALSVGIVRPGEVCDDSTVWQRGETVVHQEV